MPSVLNRALWAVCCAGGLLASSAGTAAEFRRPVDAEPDPAVQDATIRRSLGLRAYRLEQTKIETDEAADSRRIVHIDMGTGPTRLLLERYSLRSSGFSVVVQSDAGQAEVAPPAVATYRGIDESTGAPVAATVVGGRVWAAVRPEGSEPIFIQPVSDALADAEEGVSVVYAQSDIRVIDWRCGAEGMSCPDCGPIVSARGPSAVCARTVEVVFDTDYPYYQQRGSSEASVTSDVESIANQVDLIYRRDLGVAIQVRQITVRASATADPYNAFGLTSINPSSLLNAVGTAWAGVSTPSRDLVHLMTGRDLASSTIGVAWIAVVCRSSSNNTGLSQSLFTTNLSMRTILTAHEMGHNFGANHDSSGGFIMGPATSPSTVAQFSTGSIGAIADYINANGACLTAAAPTVAADSASTAAGQSVVIDVLANDQSGCGLGWTLTLPTGTTAAGGAVSVSRGTGPGGRDEVRYTPPVAVPTGGLLDSFVYRAADGSGLDGQATVSVTVTGSTGGGCAADFNSSGALTVQDLFDFLMAYFGNGASADFNQSGGVSVQDIFDYLAAYFTGC